MSVFTSPRQIATLLLLVAAWCLLWRDISTANLISGAVLSWFVLWMGFGTQVRSGVRPVALVRLIALVVADLAASTVSVAREVLTPTDYTKEAVIGCQPPEGTERHWLLLVVAITLTPGTAVVDADPSTGTLYLHLLHADRADDTIAHVDRLATLAREAFPAPSTDTDNSGVEA